LRLPQALRYGMNRSLLNRILLTLVWTFVVFLVLSSGAALFSVYASDPLFLGTAMLVALAATAAVLTSMGKALGWYLGLFYVILSVSSSIWLIFQQSSAWRAPLVCHSFADVIFGATLFLAFKTTARPQGPTIP
jgi:hypothetical protein